MPSFSIVLYSAGAEYFHEAVVFAAAGSAQGKNAIIFLRGPALSAFIKGQWNPPEDEALRQGLAAWGEPENLLAELRSKGKIRVYACSAWVRMLKLDPGATAARVDAVVGLNGFLSQADGGPILYL